MKNRTTIFKYILTLYTFVLCQTIPCYSFANSESATPSIFQDYTFKTPRSLIKGENSYIGTCFPSESDIASSLNKHLISYKNELMSMEVRQNDPSLMLFDYHHQCRRCLTEALSYHFDSLSLGQMHLHCPVCGQPASSNETHHYFYIDKFRAFYCLNFATILGSEDNCRFVEELVRSSFYDQHFLIYQSRLSYELKNLASKCSRSGRSCFGSQDFARMHCKHVLDQSDQYARELAKEMISHFFNQISDQLTLHLLNQI